MGQIFEHRNLAGSVFRDVNLCQAVFDDVNLAQASIRDADLRDVSITESNIRGMTIFGVRVDRLIEAELDRLDPERARLRMADRHDPECVRRVMRRLDERRSQFFARLESMDPRHTVARPGPDQWSVVEILRHLLFAEDLYLNRWILGNQEPWNPLGLLPSFLACDSRYAGVGSETSGDWQAVRLAWEQVHRETRALVANATAELLRRDTSAVDFGQGTVGGVLQGLALHELEHLRDAEALIARFAGGSGSDDVPPGHLPEDP